MRESQTYGRGSVASESVVSVRRSHTCTVVLNVCGRWEEGESGIVASLSVGGLREGNNYVTVTQSCNVTVSRGEYWAVS